MKIFLIVTMLIVVGGLVGFRVYNRRHDIIDDMNDESVSKNKNLLKTRPVSPSQPRKE